MTVTGGRYTDQRCSAGRQYPQPLISRLFPPFKPTENRGMVSVSDRLLFLHDTVNDIQNLALQLPGMGDFFFFQRALPLRSTAIND